MAFRWRWFLILFALISSGGPVWAATKEKSAYAAAVAAFQDEMWSRAETNFIQFIQKYPQSTNAPMALLLEAQAKFKQGKLADTIALLSEPNRMAKAGPLADQYVYWIGEAQFQGADFTGAAAAFTSLANNFTNSSLRLRAIVEAAAAWAQLPDWRRHDAVLEDPNGVFQRAAQLDPGNKLVLDGQLSLENSKYQQRDFPGAVVVYQWLTNQWQTLSQAQQCRGIYLFYLAKVGQGDFAAALAAATNLARIAGAPPNQDWLATAWASQGAALEQMGHLREAVLAWQNNLTNAPAVQEREAILKIAELQIVQGQLTNAGETLTNFLAQFPEAISADIALLAAGELQLRIHAAQSDETNHLQAASAAFDRFLAVFTNSPLAGKAYLDRGWCEWLAEDTANGLADFQAAAKLLPPSEDLAVAQFKTGDALFAQTNYAGALENYRAVLDDFTNFPAVTRRLGDRALYQSLRACLALNDFSGASAALEQILKQFPSSNLAPDSALLYGGGLADAAKPAAAREVFEQFQRQFPDSPLRPQMEFAIARSYELELNWTAAIAGYSGWLNDFPTNDLQPRVDYALAWANFQAGNETNAFVLFTNFVAQFQTNDLAPQAQWWVADHFFNAGNYQDAEKNYELVFQSWPASDLACRARIMAGRSAMSRFDYSGATHYFTDVTTDTNCPADARAEALFADGAALMRLDSNETNNPSANFQHAINVFSQIRLLDPTNEAAALNAACEIGDCYIQMNNFDTATNTYAQVFTSTSAAANVALRSRAQIGFGIALEKMAMLPGADQTNLVNQALNNYVDVLHQANLRGGETADPRWVKKAGLQAAAVAENLGNWESAADIYTRLKVWLPQLGDSLDKKIVEADSHRAQKKK